MKVEPCSLCDLKATQEFQSQDGIVTSDRIDAVIACVYHLSRSQASLLLRQEKVFVSGKLMQNPSYTCHADDIISVRGYGRFIYRGEYGTTGKGRLKIHYDLYAN